MTAYVVHPTADVSGEASVGAGTRIWHEAQVRENAIVGENCIVGKGVYVGAGVAVGRNCKIQNHASLFEGLTLEDGVFVGPAVVFANDLYPRAINADGALKSADDWEMGKTVVGYGAAVGASSVVLPGLHIGRWALVGAGSVVTRDVRDHEVVRGNPAKPGGWVCVCGRMLADDLSCAACGASYSHSESGLEEVR